MALSSAQEILFHRGFYVLQTPSGELFWGLIQQKNSSYGQFVSFDEKKSIDLAKPYSIESLLKPLGQLKQSPLRVKLKGQGFLEYKKRFLNFKNQDQVQKAVLYETHRANHPLNLNEYVFCLKRLLQSAMTLGTGYLYGFFDPQNEQAFLGLSPEYLYRSEGAETKNKEGEKKEALGREPLRLFTRAVAGSQKASEFKAWSEKLKKEHQMVEEGIKKSLGEAKAFFSAPQTMVYGDLVHLRSEASLQGVSLQSLSKALHPTPAIGTLPKEFSLQMDLGPTPRGFYGGYAEMTKGLLPFSMVTIRGLEWEGGSLKASIGGGVLHESLLEQEWNELNFKWEQFKKLWGL